MDKYVNLFISTCVIFFWYDIQLVQICVCVLTHYLFILPATAQVGKKSIKYQPLWTEAPQLSESKAEFNRPTNRQSAGRGLSMLGNLNRWFTYVASVCDDAVQVMDRWRHVTPLNTHHACLQLDPVK